MEALVTSRLSFPLTLLGLRKLSQLTSQFEHIRLCRIVRQQRLSSHCFLWHKGELLRAVWYEFYSMVYPIPAFATESSENLIFDVRKWDCAHHVAGIARFLHIIAQQPTIFIRNLMPKSDGLQPWEERRHTLTMVSPTPAILLRSVCPGRPTTLLPIQDVFPVNAVFGFLATTTSPFWVHGRPKNRWNLVCIPLESVWATLISHRC